MTGKRRSAPSANKKSRRPSHALESHESPRLGTVGQDRDALIRLSVSSSSNEGGDGPGRDLIKINCIVSTPEGARSRPLGDELNDDDLMLIPE